MSKITFGYIVGGDEKHYKNLARSIKSLERIKQPFNIVVLDASNRIEPTKKSNVKIVPFPIEDSNKGDWYKPYMWQMRYHLNEYIETEYCFYLDTDTVIVNDRTDSLIEQAGDKFLICPHWWLNSLQDYTNKVSVNRDTLSKLTTKSLDIPYFASGIFLFQKNKHDNIFNTLQGKFNSIFKNPLINDTTGITDEVLLCLTLEETKGYKTTNGAMNHSSEREQMPLYFDEEKNKFLGKNPQDKDYEEVFAFHNDLLEFNNLSYFREEFYDELFIQKFKEACYAL